MDTAIAVFTRKSAKDIIGSGGSGSWVLNPDNARRRRYLVCCRNGHGAEIDANEPHGAAFLVGVIEDLVSLGENERGQQRYRICISACAPVLCPNTWRNWRNPVRYTSLQELGIDPNALEFVPIADAAGATEAAQLSRVPRPGARKLTIAEAKEGLAATLGISPDAIEIVIRS